MKYSSFIFLSILFFLCGCGGGDVPENLNNREAIAAYRALWINHPVENTKEGAARELRIMNQFLARCNKMKDSPQDLAAASQVFLKMQVEHEKRFPPRTE